MMPIGPLMIEHRLIERMVSLLEKEINNIEASKKTNSDFIHAAVDFFKTYADKTHHGKEEDILFKELNKKPLVAEHKKIMDELVAEHIVARQNVKGLLEANQAYSGCGNNSLAEITRRIRALIGLYPPHIQKEDKRFFIPVMDYFSEKEQQAMLTAFLDFDKSLIHGNQTMHEKYRKLVEKYE
jgi:hemerythrin-like domain-containing protein